MTYAADLTLAPDAPLDFRILPGDSVVLHGELVITAPTCWRLTRRRALQVSATGSTWAG